MGYMGHQQLESIEKGIMRSFYGHLFEINVEAHGDSLYVIRIMDAPERDISCHIPLWLSMK